MAKEAKKSKGKKGKVPTIKVRHIYDVPELYEVVYFRSKAFKAGEAGIFAYIMQREHPNAQSILELFSGEDSKHKKVFLEEYAFADRVKEGYCGTDGAKTDATYAQYADNMIFADDIVTQDFGRTFDAIFGYFFSLDCVVDFDTGYVTRERTQQMLDNAYKHLNDGGLLLMDSCVDGFVTSTDPEQYHSIAHHWVDYNQLLNRMLREKYGVKIEPTDDVEVCCVVDRSYDRPKANWVDQFKDVEVKVRGKVVLRYKIELPMCVRYFSEPEIYDMLRIAGFTQVDQWYAAYEEHDVYKLDENLQFAEGATIKDRTKLLGNLFAAFKNPPKRGKGK